MQYFDAIAKVIADRTGYDVESIAPDSSFKELGIDSLDTVEMLMELEDIVGFQIDLDKATGTVQELDQYMQSISK